VITAKQLPLNTFLPLVGNVKDYAWGQTARPGRVPYIADLLGVHAQPDLPFAELWLGAHETAPAIVTMADGAHALDALASQYPDEILGPGVSAAGFDGLPFLLKILACDRPLSIQAHPDKALAARLHARNPQHYPDANHKPEIAIALTDFEAMCSFRHARDIRADLARHGLLDSIFATLPEGDPWLKAAYTRLLTVEDAVVREAGQRLVETVQTAPAPTVADRCFLKLWGHYPGDRGTLSAYFLNHVSLRPGESIFLAANEPHAYIEGVIVECMANSNNVVRAGCTPKPIDREVLLAMLAYREGPPATQAGHKIPGGRCYQPPVPEFAVDLLDLKAGESVESASNGLVSILLVLDGTFGLQEPNQSPRIAQRGSAWLWPAALPSATFLCQSETGQLVRARPNF